MSAARERRSMVVSCIFDECFGGVWLWGGFYSQTDSLADKLIDRVTNRQHIYICVLELLARRLIGDIDINTTVSTYILPDCAMS